MVYTIEAAKRQFASTSPTLGVVEKTGGVWEQGGCGVGEDIPQQRTISHLSGALSPLLFCEPFCQNDSFNVIVPYVG